MTGPATEWEWATRAPGEYPATCRFCGDPVMVELVQNGDLVRVLVSHDVPLCAEAARIYEDVVE